MTDPKQSVPAIPPDHEPTADEQAAMESFGQRNRKSPGVKVSKSEKGIKILPDHPDEVVGMTLVANAIGANDLHFLQGVFQQLCNASSTNGVIDEAALNAMLSVIKGVEPKDQIEAMLGVQMAAVHKATMEAASRLAHADNDQRREGAERSISKLVRTFVTLVEALKRHRIGGEQKMTIQHVNVNEGGQAIVGNITHAKADKPSAGKAH